MANRQERRVMIYKTAQESIIITGETDSSRGTCWAYLESSSSSLVEVDAADGFLFLLIPPPPSSESSSELSYSSVDTPAM